MSMPVIRHEVELMLDEVNLQISDAEAKRAKGGEARVEAAGELVYLKRQKETLEARLREIDADPQAHETLFQWIKEDVFNLKLRLAHWLSGK